MGTMVELDGRLAALEGELQKVAAERNRYAALFDQAPVACVLTDAAGTIREANAAAAALLGAETARTLHGAKLASFIPMEQRKTFELRLGIAGHAPRCWHGALRRASGDTAVRISVTCMAAVAALCWTFEPLS